MIDIGSRTRAAGVIGWPVEHSLSPRLHNAAYAAAGVDAVYLALAVPPARLRDALAGARALGMLGVNVTVPHKREALVMCDEADEPATVLGAVNTVVIAADGRLIGANTDVEGFRRALIERLGGEGRVPARAVVLGAGGAARAVVLALAGLRVEVAVVARDAEKGRPLLELGAREVLPWTPTALARTLPTAGLLVDATSTGLAAATEEMLPAPLPLDRLPADSLACSLIYHRQPGFLASARARGLATMDGAAMLLHQAALAFTLMTARSAPIDAMRLALSA